jgi:tRNA(Ile)-lysidine synthase
MLNKIQENILDKSLFLKTDTILIGVSGGVDSMVLACVLLDLGYPIAIAHVNYKMRVEQSDLDEKLVESFANVKNIPFHKIDFPEELKTKNNFQDQARKFRYNYFYELCNQYNYQKIATAHHINDEIESFFIHLLRSAGLEGLSGIDAKVNDKIVRPLLIINKEEIYDFAKEYKIPFREDESNAENKYLRNKIRNLLLPVLIDIDANATLKISKSIQHLKDSEALLNALLNENNLVETNEDGIVTIKGSALASYHNSASVLYFIGKKYGFNRQQANALIASSSNGAKSINADFEMIKDRNNYIIRPVAIFDQFRITIQEEGTYFINGSQVTLSLIEKNDIVFEKNTEYLSFANNPFPIVARSRQNGDEFMPIGMNGRSKSLKKYLIDEKIDQQAKEKIILFTHEEFICYVFPYRISEAYKVDTKNPFILKIVRTQ